MLICECGNSTKFYERIVTVYKVDEVGTRHLREGQVTRQYFCANCINMKEVFKSEKSICGTYSYTTNMGVAPKVVEKDSV